MQEKPYNVEKVRLEDMIEVFRARHPYEVVSTIMKTLVDANKDLVQMIKR